MGFLGPFAKFSISQSLVHMYVYKFVCTHISLFTYIHICTQIHLWAKNVPIENSILEADANTCFANKIYQHSQFTSVSTVTCFLRYQKSPQVSLQIESSIKFLATTFAYIYQITIHNLYNQESLQLSVTNTKSNL